MNKSSTTTQAAASTEGTDPDRGVVEQAKQTASSVASRAKDGFGRQIELRKERTVGTMHDIADAVRKTGADLKEPLPTIAERAADGIERVSRFVESHEVRDAIQGIERFARREPALFLGGAVGLGLLVGRFMKSSAQHVGEEHVGEEIDTSYSFEADADEAQGSYVYGEQGYAGSFAEEEESEEPYVGPQPGQAPDAVRR